MGQVMKIVGMFLKRKPAGEITLRGFCGMTLGEGDGHPVVEAVLEKGPAGDAGLKKGDVVKKVNDTAVKSVPDVVAITANTPGKSEVVLTIERKGETKEITIKTQEGI
jgi:S1-C subfamily serine protease